jgi:(1->4)-alpha-D-glucan 1-alpha-D-glucosylmutase
LAQTLVKITAPGVPDFYQGTEVWNHTLVDPDNRRPVDYARCRRLLDEAEGLDCEAVLARADEGMPKQWVIRRALRLRRERPEVFGPEGDYRPLTVTGCRSDRVLAFSRGGDAVVTVVPRLVFGSAGSWEDTAVDLPAGPWRSVLTDEGIDSGGVRVGELWSRFPVALLRREEVGV